MTTLTTLSAARAEALFASELPTGSHPSSAEVGAAISRAVRRHGGARGCGIMLAGEYGDHPDTAVPRMRWAIGLVESTYWAAVAERRQLQPAAA
jgi:hypothetical protein